MSRFGECWLLIAWLAPMLDQPTSAAPLERPTKQAGVEEKQVRPDEWREKLSKALPLPPETVKALWADVDSPDAVRAYQAIRKLAAAPRQTLALVPKYLRSVPQAEPEQIGRWIADLDDPRFVVRQKATGELEKFGGLVEPALRRALKGNPSLEARRRIERLLEAAGDPNWYPGRLRVLRIVPLLEEIGTLEARQMLTNLSKGKPEDQVTQNAKAALERLARRHESPKDRAKDASATPTLTIVVHDAGRYLKDPTSPVPTRTLKFTCFHRVDQKGDQARIEASHFGEYNGFKLGYVLRGKVDVAKLGKKELDIGELSEAQITYTDDLLEAKELNKESVEQLIQQLYEPENRVKWWGTIIPGGEMLLFSPPMKKLILLGEKARVRLQQCLADPRIQNEVALILGAIGTEQTVPLLIDVYPENRVTGKQDLKEDSRSENVMYLTFALAYLTGQHIGRNRAGADYQPENRSLWRAWWVKERQTFKVPKEKPNATWVPSYPVLSEDWAKRSRKRLATGRDD